MGRTIEVLMVDSLIPVPENIGLCQDYSVFLIFWTYFLEYRIDLERQIGIQFGLYPRNISSQFTQAIWENFWRETTNCKEIRENNYV